MWSSPVSRFAHLSVESCVQQVMWAEAACMLQVAETHEMVFCKPIKLLFGALLYIKSVQIFYTRQSLSP